jgi:hypothetical protein
MQAKAAIGGGIALFALVVLVGVTIKGWWEQERRFEERLAAYQEFWRGATLVRICGRTHIYRLRDGRHVTSWPPESGTPVDINTIC